MNNKNTIYTIINKFIFTTTMNVDTDSMLTYLSQGIMPNYLIATNMNKITTNTALPKFQ